MDEQLDQLPVHSKDTLSTESVELNKKRKLQFDLELPLSKHKFRDRSRSGDHAAAEETDDIQKWIKQIARELRDDPEELGESCNESNSVSEGYETTLTSDLDDEAGKSSGKTASPYVSLSNLKMEGDFDPFSIQNVRESTDTERDMKDYDAYIKNSLENLNGEIDDALLYSNDLAPHAFLLSSESWMSGQDARSSAKKPTIDKEFEQYFSMLML